MTYAKLDGGREELNTGLLSNGITASHTGQVNEGRLNDALLTLGSLDDGLGESTIVSHVMVIEVVIERVGAVAPGYVLTGNQRKPWRE